MVVCPPALLLLVDVDVPPWFFFFCDSAAFFVSTSSCKSLIGLPTSSFLYLSFSEAEILAQSFCIQMDWAMTSCTSEGAVYDEGSAP